MREPRRPGLFKRLTNALFEDVDAQEEAARRAAAAAAQAQVEVVEDDPFTIDVGMGAMPTRGMQVAGAQARFESRMRDLLEENRSGAAGKLQLVGLEAIREQLGDRWEAIADKARKIAESVIERRLAPGDVVAPFESDGFLVLFADLSEEQARFKAAAIAQEIHDRLLGEIGDAQPWVHAFAASFTHLIPEGELPPRLADLGKALGAGLPLVPAVTPGGATGDAPLFPQQVAPADKSSAGRGAAGPAGTPLDPEAAARKAGGPPPPEDSRPAGRSIQESGAARALLESRLAQVMTESKPTIVGKTQFIDLQKIKDQFGERWEEIASRARAIASSIIESRIARSDVFAPVDADSFLILFAELDEESARLKVTAIAREIYERLLGELGLGPEHMPASFVAEVAAVASRPPIPNDPDIMAEIAAVLATTEVIRPPERIAGLDVDLQRRIGELVVGFRPTWFRPKAVLSLFDARVMRLDAQQRMQFGAAAYPANDPPVVFEIDRTVLQAALAGVRHLAEKGQIALVQAPVTLQSLMTHSGGLLVDLCRALHPNLRKLLIVEIAGLGASKPNARVSEAIATIQPFCRKVSLRVPLGFSDFDYLTRHGVGSVGVDLEDHGDPAVAAPNLPALMSRFVTQAHQHKVTAHLYGIARPDTARQARDAGFDYLNGPAVTGVVRQPGRVLSFQPKL